MCGIVAYYGSKNASPILLEGLKRLEYRGYDSAGIAVLNQDGLHHVKAVGAIRNLEPMAVPLPSSNVGIAHTRWATHGPPTENNAHPHLDCGTRFAVVHNGIIENYSELKKQLEEQGHVFHSQTDTEVLAHLLEEGVKHTPTAPLSELTRQALLTIHGTYGVAVLDKQQPDQLVAARLGSPMAIGVGEQEYIIASDPSAILTYTRQVIFLDDYELATFSKDGMRIQSLKTAQQIDKNPQTLEWSLEDVQKNGQPHFMLKEMLEEADIVRNTMRGRLSKEHATAVLGGLKDIMPRLESTERLLLIGCGTAYYAGCFGKYLLEEWAGIPTDVEIASEFRYRDPVVSKNSTIIAISQSGETADTLGALREGKMKGALPLGIVNVVGSTITRETMAGVYCHAGPEISVASTKAFVSQCTVFALLALLLGRKHRLSHTEGIKILEALEELPALIKEILSQREKIMEIAKNYAKYEHMIFLGRKYHAPIAHEGALKLKEVSYIHAEGYPAGEIKHGPLALIDQNMPITVLCPKDSVFEKTLSNIQELRAREGRVLAITTPDGETSLSPHVNDLIVIPKTIEALQPILSVIPLQLIAYSIAVARGYNPDRPRNLAKSVTVE